MVTMNVRSARRPNPVYASALARYAQKRRLQMKMAVAEAAARSGLDGRAWEALEAGWIPADDSVVGAIAEALHTEEAPLAIVAMIGRCNQSSVA